MVDLDDLEKKTLQDYANKAEFFWEKTKDHDVTQNYEALLSHLPQDKEMEILDLGCGPGRDVFYFKSQGHKPTGLDGCATFCSMAREYTGCPILQQSFYELDLQDEAFHGIFANATLQHIPRETMPRVFRELWKALKPQGIFFSSIPRGDHEGWQGDQFRNSMELPVLQSFLEEAGFTLVDHYYRPKGKPREQQPWLATVAQKNTK